MRAVRALQGRAQDSTGEPAARGRGRSQAAQTGRCRHQCRPRPDAGDLRRARGCCRWDWQPRARSKRASRRPNRWSRPITLASRPGRLICLCLPTLAGATSTGRRRWRTKGTHYNKVGAKGYALDATLSLSAIYESAGLPRVTAPQPPARSEQCRADRPVRACPHDRGLQPAPLRRLAGRLSWSDYVICVAPNILRWNA